jgi:nitrogen-specific signal transduction histidine kinase
MPERDGDSDGGDDGRLSRFDHRRQLVASLLGAVAHEINNPVQSIMNYAQLLRARVQDPALEGFATEIFDEARRISSLVKNLQGLTAESDAMMTEVAVAAVVEDVLALVESLLHKDGIAVDVDVPADLPRVTGRTNDLKHLLLTLLLCMRRELLAADAARAGESRVDLRAERVVLEGETWVRVRVLEGDRRRNAEEPGLGVDAAARHDDGTGSALAVAAGIVAEHAGRLDVRRAASGSTCFTLELPAVRVGD